MKRIILVFTIIIALFGCNDDNLKRSSKINLDGFYLGEYSEDIDDTIRGTFRAVVEDGEIKGSIYIFSIEPLEAFTSELNDDGTFSTYGISDNSYLFVGGVSDGVIVGEWEHGGLHGIFSGTKE